MSKSRPLFLLLAFLLGCSGGGNTTERGSGQFKLEAWADNWFAMYDGDKLIVEDSVAITTERSFNAEVFSFDAELPMNLNFILEDYKENDSGLEYIGTEQQQMGDGGFIAQITDSETGKVVLVSSAAWKCNAIHKAPTNKACEKDSAPEKTCLSEITEEPAGWKDEGYDVSGWSSAKEHDESAVSPKDGYDEIDWSEGAKLIWTSDLETDNTVLCKITVESL